MKIGVTGATGQLGRLALQSLKLRAPDAALVALARTPDRAADLDAETRALDYTDPSTHAAALAGLDVVVLISSNDFNDRPGQHRAIIAAAQAAGVGRVVYTSILKGPNSPLILAADHAVTEGDLIASGMPYTILRNGWYTENYTASLPAALKAGAVIGSAGAGRLSTATRADFAEAIAVVAAQPGHENRIYELAGDTSYTLADLAAELSRAVGRTIPYQDLPPTTYAGILKSFGLPEGLAAAIADADAHAAHGALHDDGRALSGLIGRPTTPLADAVRQAVG